MIPSKMLLLQYNYRGGNVGLVFGIGQSDISAS
uniref:Uncharacterized protein n=1 Tax=Anguilla anguilla TaxID=7936 RepID=A0A0E9PIY3_ANGAN